MKKAPSQKYTHPAFKDLSEAEQLEPVTAAIWIHRALTASRLRAAKEGASFRRVVFICSASTARNIALVYVDSTA